MSDSSVDIGVTGVGTARAEGNETGKVPLTIGLTALEGTARVSLECRNERKGISQLIVIELYEHWYIKR